MLGLAHYAYLLGIFLLSGHALARETCGGKITASSGKITSPGYPDSYPANTTCIWDIHAPTRANITLNFTDVDLASELKPCPNGDYIHVWGERNGQAFYRTKLICGNHSSSIVLKNVDNRMRILFKSDEEEEAKGFSATFHSEMENSCGGVLKTSPGNFSSPNYPNQYPASIRCVWDIIAPIGNRIVLTINDFELENRTSGCPDKFIIWSRQIGGQFRRQMKLCGLNDETVMGPVYISPDHHIRVEFKSDTTVEERGFQVSYNFDNREPIDCGYNYFRCRVSGYCVQDSTLCDGTDDCGDGSDEAHCQGMQLTGLKQGYSGQCKHNVSTSSGNILSPSFHQENGDQEHCTWYFKTQPGHKIKLDFHKLALLEGYDISRDCSHDHIRFHHGDNREAPVLDYFCGDQDLPLTILSKDHHLLMTYKTSPSIKWQGFNMSHTTECGGEYQVDDSLNTLYSHSDYGTRNYSSNINCLWELTASEGSQIELNFTTFELCYGDSQDNCFGNGTSNDFACNEANFRDCAEWNQSYRSCDNDFLEITEIINSLHVTVGRFCGNNLPARIVSSRNILRLQFITDENGSARGFSAVYRSQTPEK